ncbi:hypothetical protein D3C80_1833960 [compost metagenome]
MLSTRPVGMASKGRRERGLKGKPLVCGSAARASPGMAAPRKARVLMAAPPINSWRRLSPPIRSLMCGLSDVLLGSSSPLPKSTALSLCWFKADLHAGESTEI